MGHHSVFPVGHSHRSKLVSQDDPATVEPFVHPSIRRPGVTQLSAGSPIYRCPKLVVLFGEEDRRKDEEILGSMHYFILILYFILFYLFLFFISLFLFFITLFFIFIFVYFLCYFTCFYFILFIFISFYIFCLYFLFYFIYFYFTYFILFIILFYFFIFYFIYFAKCTPSANDAGQVAEGRNLLPR
jgi:cellulose synthase/poly-beta-1,6-N-acetylglucosamine synthase-like glycosyltransferase